jgi:branched-chain amino acid transport system substrate-binding protein
VYFFGPPNEAFAVGPLQSFHQAGLNKITLTVSNLPSSVTFVNTEVTPVAKKLKMDYHVTYYDSASVNWQVVSNALLTSNPQVTGIIAGPEGDCNSLISALRGNGFKGPVLMGSCSAYVTGNPSGAVNTYSYSAGWLPNLRAAAPPVVQKQIDTYNAAMAAVGQKDTAALGQWAVNAFSGLVDFHDALTAAHLSTYTAETVNGALAAVKNYQSFMGPVETCDHKQWPGTSSCNHDLLFVKVAAGDVYQSLEPGGFAALDPSLL